MSPQLMVNWNLSLSGAWKSPSLLKHSEIGVKQVKLPSVASFPPLSRRPMYGSGNMYRGRSTSSTNWIGTTMGCLGFLHAKKQALQSTVLTPSLLSGSIVLLGGYAQTTTFTAPFFHSMRHCFGTWSQSLWTPNFQRNKLCLLTNYCTTKQLAWHFP